jgi:hypothetical protein
MERNTNLNTMISSVGLMLMAHADLGSDLTERQELEELFRSTLLAAHVLNIVGPLLIQRGYDLGLTAEDFDSLSLDVVTEGAAQNLTPEDFA